MVYIPPMPSVRHGDATIHYEEFGQGFPILTFAPAGLQSQAQDERPADALAVEVTPVAQPGRVAAAVLAQPIGRVGPKPAGRTPRFQAWAETLTDHPEATPAVLDALSRNLYERGFVYCVDRAFVSTCAAPCLILAGNDEAHPLPISEELAKLLPTCELVREWKTEPALTSARARVTEFLAKHTPGG